MSGIPSSAVLSVLLKLVDTRTFLHIYSYSQIGASHVMQATEYRVAILETRPGALESWRRELRNYEYRVHLM